MNNMKLPSEVLHFIEHTIYEVHHVERMNNYMVKVDLTYDLYGAEKRDKHVFHKKAWEKFEKSGFFLS